MSEQSVNEIDKKETIPSPPLELDAELVLEPIPEQPQDPNKVAIEERLPEEIDLADPELYFNRELSHLQFNLSLIHI